MKRQRNYHLLVTGQFLGACGDMPLTLGMKLTTKNPAPAKA